MQIIKAIKTNIIKYSKIYKAVTIGILIIVGILAIWYTKKPKAVIQAKKVDSFFMVEEPIYFAFTRLAGENLIPLGFEESALMDIECEKPLSIELENTTVKDVLDALLNLDKNYYWEERNGIINVMPVSIKKDKTYILNQTIDRFVVNNKTRVEIVEQLLELLEPRYKEKPLYIDEPKDIDLKRHSFKFKNKTVREILNEIAKTENLYWYVLFFDSKELGLGKIRLVTFFNLSPRESVPE